MGTQNFTIANNLLTRLDGNAVFIGGFNRNLSISENEFELIGENAMASWGETSNKLDGAGKQVLPWAVGAFGT